MNIFSRIIEFITGGFSRVVSVLFGRGRWKLIVNGLGVTLLLSLFSVIIGTVIGTVVALIKVAASTVRNRSFKGAEYRRHFM